VLKTKKKNRKIRREEKEKGESSNAPRAMLTCYRVPKQQRAAFLRVPSSLSRLLFFFFSK
jgi:hypothetical protein